MGIYTPRKASLQELENMKQQYRDHLAAPIDGMWEIFVDMADQYAIQCDGDVVGYAAINAEHQILQFYVQPAHDAKAAFSVLITELNIKGAIVETCETHYLSLCRDHQASVEVNALMYHVAAGAYIAAATFPSGTIFKQVEMGNLETATNFGAGAIGADENWLRGYYSERIEKGELFALWQDNHLIAAGECRPRDTQKPYADVGMVVSQDHRSQGLATQILRQLIHISNDKGLKAICSTENSNIAAQKAITKAGFSQYHKILDVTF